MKTTSGGSIIKVLGHKENYRFLEYPSGLHTVDYVGHGVGMTLFASDDPKKAERQFNDFASLNEIERSTAKKAGYVQGVCECVAAIGDDHTLGKKLLTEMNVTKDMAKILANPETFKVLEQGIFAPKPEQKLEQTQGFKR